MKILLATSEAVPFAKTGGLADVSGTLPQEIARLGHEIVVVLPAYRQTREAGIPIHDTGISFEVPVAGKLVAGRFLKSSLPDSDVPVYLVENSDYFGREELYGEDTDYADNCERFVFFCRAIFELLDHLDLRIDVLHANDWQTALALAYLKTDYAGLPLYEKAVSLLTVHNIAYQGQFWHWDMLLTGLDWKYFNWQQMEFFGKLNLLKTGLVFADAINTVSPRYAEEIQREPLGCGLEGVLQHRRDVLSGIINGVDYRVWNPALDPNLPAQFDAEHPQPGKSTCKQELQRELGLRTDPDVPLVGFVGRLVEQKGVDLIAGVMREWLPTQSVQWAILGTGDPRYHEILAELARRHPGRAAVRLEFSNSLAHRIEAGADIFAMPSQFEPCGLNQLYSLKYGTVPVVRATGGLADTITNFDDRTQANRTANGFAFREFSRLALAETLQRACDCYRQPDVWRQIMETGMRQDWSWGQSARKYVALYERTIQRCRESAWA